MRAEACQGLHSLYEVVAQNCKFHIHPQVIFLAPNFSHAHEIFFIVCVLYRRYCFTFQLLVAACESFFFFTFLLLARGSERDWTVNLRRCGLSLSIPQGLSLLKQVALTMPTRAKITKTVCSFICVPVLLCKCRQECQKWSQVKILRGRLRLSVEKAETKFDWQQVCALENQWPNDPLRLWSVIYPHDSCTRLQDVGQSAVSSVVAGTVKQTAS